MALTNRIRHLLDKWLVDSTTKKNNRTGIATPKLNYDGAMTTRLIPAVGGYIAEVYKDKYDEENNTTFYLIGDTQDVGEEVSKIINLELLKNGK